MQNNKVVYGIYFTLCSLLAVYFISTGGRASQSLMAGQEPSASRSGVSEADRAVGEHKGSSGNSDFSLMESDFMAMGVPDAPIPDEPAPKKKEDGEPEILEPTSKDNPMNPQTGSQYTDSMMNAFAEMRKKFPNNSIIPRKYTEEEKAAQAQAQREHTDLRLKIGQGNASQDEVNQFYDHELKLVKDREEIITHIMERSPNMPSELKEQYDKIVERNKANRENLEREREKHLSGR